MEDGRQQEDKALNWKGKRQHSVKCNYKTIVTFLLDFTICMVKEKTLPKSCFSLVSFWHKIIYAYTEVSEDACSTIITLHCCQNHSSMGYLDLAGFCICAQSWRMQCICKTVLKYISNWTLWGIFQGVCEQRDIQVSKGRGLWAQNFIFVYLLILKKKLVLSIYFACMPSVLRGQRRTTPVLWNWSDRQLCFVRWILGIETRSSAKTAGILSIDPSLQPPDLFLIVNSQQNVNTVSLGFNEFFYYILHSR